MKCWTKNLAAEAKASPPSRGAWIEIHAGPITVGEYLGSPPSRGAWIEIFCRCAAVHLFDVAPLAGGVD